MSAVVIEAPGRQHHQADRAAEIAAIDPEQELDPQYDGGAGRKPRAQRGAEARAEGERDGRGEQEPRQHAVENGGGRPQQQQRARKPADQRRDQRGDDRQPFNAREAVAIDPRARGAAGIERDRARCVGRHRRQARGDQRRQGHEAAAARERIHGAGEEAGGGQHQVDIHARSCAAPGHGQAAIRKGRLRVPRRATPVDASSMRPPRSSDEAQGVAPRQGRASADRSSAERRRIPGSRATSRTRHPRRC